MPSSNRAPGASPREQISRERAWGRFVAHRDDVSALPDVVRNSWLRCRDFFAIDPALTQTPVVLSEDDWRERREHLAPMRLGLPFLEHLIDGLRGTQHGLGLLDSDCHVLVTMGDAAVLDELSELNFRPGGNWREQFVGTNGPGTALVENRPVQIIGSDHYVQALRKWSCTAAPIRDPKTGNVIAIIDVTGRAEVTQAHTLLAVYSTAALIEQRLLLEYTIEGKLLCEAFVTRMKGRPADAMLAIDCRGQVLHINAAAERMLAARGDARAQHLIDELKSALNPGFDYPGLRELELDSHALGRQIRVAAFGVAHQHRTIGAIVTLPSSSVPQPISRPQPVPDRNAERTRLLAVLSESGGNVAEAARRLGFSRVTLYNRLRKWSISRLEVLEAVRSVGN